MLTRSPCSVKAESEALVSQDKGGILQELAAYCVEWKVEGYDR